LVRAQEQPRRPKVGLVLSGGAAKGLAHIGVLKILEEAGIQPDYITGTSMGSIIGGLYAVGYSPDSLHRLAISQNWAHVLSDNIPLKQVAFEEKLYFKNQLVELPFRDGGLKTPSGLVQGQQIEELLNRLFLPAYAVEHFDELPIPFHCMAADIVSGAPVEISRGYLPQALRASMAIPSIFTPVHKDSMVLVDGGLIRNYPVQEMVQMGADIIIGVYVGAKPKSEQRLESLPQILSQIAFMQSIDDYDRQIPLVDLHIEPDLGEYGAQDFSAADTIIALGERAARKEYDQLRQLADSLNTFGPPYPHPRLPPVNDLTIDRIEVLGNQQVSDEEVIGKSGLYPGKTVNARQLDEAVEQVYGSNRYEKVSYRLRHWQGEDVLYFHTEEKSPLLLKGSLIYDSYHEAGLAVNLTFRNLLLPSSRLMFIGRLANNYRYRIEYLKYIDRQQSWFLNLDLQYNRDAIPLLEEGRVVEEFRLQDAPMTLTLNKRLGKNGVLSLGAQFELLSFQPTVSVSPLFDELHYQNFNLLLALGTNTLDRNVLPRRGNRTTFEIKYVQNSGLTLDEPAPELSNADSLFRFDPYPRITFRSENYLFLSQRSSLVLSPFAGILGTSDTPLSDFYLVGAPETLTRRSIPMYGLNPNEFVAQIALGLDIGLQIFPRDNLRFGLHANAGFFSQPELGEAGIPPPNIFLSGLGLTAAYNSFIGPVKLSVMYPLNTDGNIKSKLKAFLTVGHRF